MTNIVFIVFDELCLSPKIIRTACMNNPQVAHCTRGHGHADIALFSALGSHASYLYNFDYS